MNLRRPARGPRVRALQQMLNAAGHGPLIDDGIFGLQTESAVRLFQEAAGLTVDGIVGPRTTDALTQAQTEDTGQEPAVLQAVRRLGHEVYDDKMNIIGVRAVPGVQNRFDDQLHIIFKDGDNWQHKVYPCTTDPGTYWLENPMHVDGTAKLVPNQYVDAYGWGMHRGKYEALVQIGPVTVARDDGLLDTGLHSINIHSAGQDSQRVNKWSAGCTVVQRLEDYQHMIALCRASGQEVFTYTLILSTDVT